MNNVLNLFKKKKPKPWVRFHSLEPGLAECYPVKPTSSIKRAWQDKETKEKKCPFQGSPNSSNCPAINQIVRMGWVVVAPMDFIITTNGDGVSFTYETPGQFSRVSDDYISNHKPDQVIPLIDSPRDSLAHIVKVDTPWRLTSSDDVVLLQQHVHWNNEDRFTAVTGIFDPRYAMQVNMQLQWHVMDSGTDGTLVKAGTPLAQYIPIPRISLEKGWYDITVNNATNEDWELEHAFNYSVLSGNAEYKIHDSFQGRISRAMKVLNYHKNI